MGTSVVSRGGATVFAAMIFLVACAQERPAISRIQPNAVPKSFFVGDITDPSDNPEFYLRATVVDVAAGADSDGLFTSSDAQPTTRVRFEIAEKLLVARLTYERVNDTDYKGVRRTTDGQIVAAFAIEKHLDIRRDYNATTGEQLNVLVENDADRPWHVREYMRVDWSRNLITDAYELDALSQLGIYYGVKWDPVAYYVSDPTHPDAPIFDFPRGYFDVTHRAYAAPQVVRDPEWGDFPACWLVGKFPFANCNTNEITLRLSFLKVEDRDYEPLDFDGVRMDMFGWFTSDRFGYDRRYGVVDNRWHRFATRWNLYERSHASPAVACNTAETTPAGKSPNRDENQDGTEDECESVGRGSRCDPFRGECTLPMRDRKVRTIPWYVNRAFPEDLFEGTSRALDAWSESIRAAIVAGRLAECRRTGEQGCEAQMGWPARWSDDYAPPVGDASPAEVPKVFVLCHNPVDPSAGDDPACGAAGTSPRLGDLRYNFVNLISSPQEMSPWGIMSDAEDPLTGEKISGSVNQWGATLDRAASTLVDILDLLNGHIDPTAFIAGQDVTEWVRANRVGGGGFARGMSVEEIESRRAAFDPSVLAPYATSASSSSRRLPAPARRKAKLRALLDSGRLGPGNAALAARMRQLRGTALEARLVSPELVQAAGFDPTAAPSREAIERASPFGMTSPMARRARVRNARAARARRHSCRIEALEPDNLLGLAKLAARQFPAPSPNDAAAVQAYRNRIWSWARSLFNMGVFAHEFGHSMGLRHNFAASFDSLNYFTQYWQLRTRNGEATADCPAGTTDGRNCVAPRWRDPLSAEEIDGNIHLYSTASVMDYPGDANHDQILIGKFDRAAVRFGYGGVVDVWDMPGVSVTGSGAAKQTAYHLSAFASAPGLFGVYDFPNVDPEQDARHIHYSQYQKEFGLLGACTASSDADAILGKKCSGAPMDVVDYRDMRDFAADPSYAQFSWANARRAVDPRGRVRRGYLFQSDEFADVGNVPAFSYDAGADAYEQVRFLESQYERRYLLDNFRRGRVQFNSWDVTARVQAHYLDAIQLIGKTFAFGAVLDGDPTQPSAALLEDGSFGALAMSSTVALDLFARMLTRPDPGYYCPSDICGAGQPVGANGAFFSADPAPQPELYVYDFQVPFGDGRYVHNDYDYAQGYWWSDYQTQVGAYYEKVWATYYLAEAFDTFISNAKEDFTDSRYKNVSFATVYPEQVRRLFTSLLTGDVSTYAPWVQVPDNPDETPLGSLVFPPWHATSLGTRPAGVKLVDPNFGFNEQLYAMVWGAMYFPTNWSQQWVDEARITVLGQDQVDWTAAETVTFREPESGLTYRAHHSGTETIFRQRRQRGVGARMLEWANDLVTQAYVVERDGSGNPRLNADGTPIVLRDGDGLPRRNASNAAAFGALRKHIDMINILRQLTSLFARPLDDTDLPMP